MKLALTTALVFGIAAPAVQASQVYFNDFEGGVGLGGTGAIVDVQGYEGVNGITGSFWHNETVKYRGVEESTLSLGGIGDHDFLTISFDIAFIDSWDGNIGRAYYGPDFFNILIDGVTQLVTTNFGGIGDELSDKALGFYGFEERYDDEAYRYSATFAHTSDTAEFSFFADGAGWQGKKDESWAIDNLSISTGSSELLAAPVPAALPLMLGGLGLLGFAGMRRRKG